MTYQDFVITMLRKYNLEVGADIIPFIDNLLAEVEYYKNKAPKNYTSAPKLGDCLREAEEVICGERQDTYGRPENSFALIADYWNVYLDTVAYMGPRLKAKDVAHMMILFKMARTHGQSPSRDNYVDLCGYASIAADRLHEDTKVNYSRDDLEEDLLGALEKGLGE